MSLSGVPLTRGCFHCGEAVANDAQWQIVFDGQSRPLCCGGCEAVANTIISAGLQAYYRQRSEPDNAGSIVGSLATDLDATLAQAGAYGALQTDSALQTDGRASDTLDLMIEGMHCGACAWLLEQGLMAQPGVVQASVNLATERARVRIDPGRSDLTRLLKTVARLGFRAAPFESSQLDEQHARFHRVSLQRLFVAGIGMMQVMMVALPAYLTNDGDIETQYANLLRWAALVLTTPVIAYSGWPFFRSAFQNLRFGRLGIDVPVSIGLAAAYCWSVTATFSGTGEVYFDSVTMFVFLLLLARHLQWLVRRKGLARIAALGARSPVFATLQVDGQERLVNPTSLQPGDPIMVATGQCVPVDSELSQASTTIDQSILTGESEPVFVQSGDAVAAGCFVTGPSAHLTVRQTVQNSAVSRLESLVARGFDEKPRWVLLADRIAAGFVLVVMALAFLVWLTWMSIDSSQAWPIAMTVLVVSCPCALSLATPSALSAATGGLIGHGILVTRADAMEALAQATDVVFDKTGTLTEGRPQVVAVDITQASKSLLEPSFDSNAALLIAAALEASAEHPFARALRLEAAKCDATGGWQDSSVMATDHKAGFGVAGTLTRADGTTISLSLGSAQWCGIDASATEWPQLVQASEVFLVMGSPSLEASQLLARFSFTDVLRPQAQATVAALQASGLAVHLLSGDRQAVVTHVANELGFTSVVANARPEQKQAFVRQLQAQGRRVIMVGDGMNDAPVLALADASVAVGQASDLARTAADVIALNPEPGALVLLLARAQMTRRIITQNLLWAAGYNSVMVPAAAIGWIAPWFAALGMALSSWLVVANAARLWRGKSLVYETHDGLLPTPNPQPLN